jgi:hypothetical protein
VQERLYCCAILRAEVLPQRKIMLRVTIEDFFLAFFGARDGAFTGIYA